MTKLKRATYSAAIKLETAQLVVDQGYRSLDVRLPEQFSLIEKLNQRERYPISVLCSVFNVHRSSYKYWAIRDTTPTPEQIRLEAEVKAIHAMSSGSAGARTIAAIAMNNGFELSRYRAAKLMVKLKLESCQVPQHQYKRGGNEHLEIPNLLDRQFDVVEPNTVWCGDVTYIWTGNRWAYLAMFHSDRGSIIQA